MVYHLLLKTNLNSSVFKKNPSKFTRVLDSFGAQFGYFILLLPGAADHPREHVHLFGQDHQAADP